MEKFLLISVGAIFGANARYWIGNWAAQKFGVNFPYGTFIINLTGSFLIGFFLTFASERLNIDPRWRLLITIGFLGAYTTFSSYLYESYYLFLDGQWLSGLINIFGSALLGFIALMTGVLLGKIL